MPARSAMDSSDRPQTRYNYRGRTSQPADGFYSQRGEHEPLLGGASNAGRKSGLSTSPITIRRSISNFFYLAALFAILFVCLGYTLDSLITSTYQKAVRYGWALEVAEHQKQMCHLEAVWEERRVRHEEQVNHDEAVWEERRAKHEEQERQRHDDEMKKRDEWALEVAKHQALRLQMEHDETVWKERQARHEEEERQRHDDEIKKRKGISWEGLAAAQCSRYATREYTAGLAHVPLGFDALQECRKKTINIHGRDLLPSHCDYQGACRRVTGHWYVDFEEPGCVTWWNRFDNKGCYSSGIRLYHSKLENLEDYDLWPVMCSTTPRDVQGVHYDGPTSCADFGNGPWGVWQIPDPNCR